jgi:molybdenum cofactor cytidylyltransferase
LSKGNVALARVLIGAAARQDPVIECWRRVSAVVLAAGASARFGSPKQLVDVGGRPMIEHILHAVRRTNVDEVVVVLGHEAAQIAPHVPTWCRMVLNEEWQAGITRSIQMGLEAIDSSTEAALFLLADQPQITSVEIDRILLAFYGSTKPIVVPAHGGQRGNPVLFDRRCFPLLRDLRGDVGGRQLLERSPDQVREVEMPTDHVLLDIDTQNGYAEYLRRVKGTESDA